MRQSKVTQPSVAPVANATSEAIAITRPDAQETLADIEAALAAKTLARNEEFATAKLSRALEMALEDLALVDKDPSYTVYMSTWHSPMGDDQCAVCLAGSVMAKSLDAPKDKRVDFSTYYDTATNNRVTRRLLALNCLRVGAIGDALEHMGEKRPSGLPSEMRSVAPSYTNGREVFRSDMQNIITELKKFDL